MTELTHCETGEILNLPELIDIQSAHVTQLANNGVKGDWKVKKNITGETLATFPPNISDKLMFGILNFAKKYELIAFNAGISFQKEKQNELLLAKIDELKRLGLELASENERLATILENHIGEN
tara:strand:- start:13744 stop:14115 length:372 start_codon:yes stop_codon:yes gene_type:complete